MATPEPTIEQPASDVRDAGETQLPPIKEGRESLPPTVEKRGATEVQAARQRARRDAISKEIEIETLEEQLAILRRRGNAGNTPVASIARDQESERDETPATSVRSGHDVPVPGRSGRLKLREPRPLRGKTLKEARDFVRTLELVFALEGDAYAADRERTPYGVMFLAGELREN